MTNIENNLTAFISYAWGDHFEKKEWIRQHIVESLELKYQVFWDRDSIDFGKSIDTCIMGALNQRPLIVFCICDTDYVFSAQNVGSGLHRELQLLAEIATEKDVKIIPLIFDSTCIHNLPTLLAGRTYLLLEELYRRRLYLGDIILALADGITQAEMTIWLKQKIARSDLYKQAESYFQNHQLTIWGNAHTHEVVIEPKTLLLAPQWMWDSKKWGYMLSDDNSTFCPSKGRWHWDYGFSPSYGMRAFGTAVASAFFPKCTSHADQCELQIVGTILAKKVFSMICKTEPFVFEHKELIQILINDKDGYNALESLLQSVSLLDG
ncbi:TIR domain-containing protein [Salmonella enterica subsp. enterica serovar Texas]|nr:TIR domain-containing protein [Salmonella enterica subsp. enterica]EGZ4333866.1 TIR domain-containing protein [Salmonella enterica subsp. enterica serovar Texas]